MKINSRSLDHEPCRLESGSAVLVVVILLGIMTTLVVANSRTLYYLHRDLKFIEEKQQRKLENNSPTPLPAAFSSTNQTAKWKSKY